MTLSISNIKVHLSGKEILKNISMDFPTGKVTALLGPNGAGKSTLIRVLAGLQSVQLGDVSVNKQTLSSIPRLELAQQISYLPQTGECHWPMTVERVVMLGRHPHLEADRSPERHTQAVEQAIKDVDIQHLMGRTVNELSGGERARVMLARALATQTKVLLADEPIASLDPRHQIEVMALLQRVAKQGKTVVVVLHELHLAMRYCEHLLLLNHGEQVATGPACKVLTAENLRNVYGVDAIFGEHHGTPWVLPWLDIEKGH